MTPRFSNRCNPCNDATTWRLLGGALTALYVLATSNRFTPLILTSIRPRSRRFAFHRLYGKLFGALNRHNYTRCTIKVGECEKTHTFSRYSPSHGSCPLLPSSATRVDRRRLLSRHLKRRVHQRQPLHRHVAR